MADSELETQILTPETDFSPERLAVFFDPPGTLRLTVEDQRSYASVKLYQASPLSRPGTFLSFQSGKGEEILMVGSLNDLSATARPHAEEELKRRYLTAVVKTITNIRTEFGVTYWHVETDRGPRDFVVQSLTESCVWLSDAHILVVDVDGNRFEIADRYTLDEVSRAQLESVL